MADTLQTSLEEALKTELSTSAPLFAKDISNNVYDIAIFVEKLGFALASPSVEQRVSGIELLTEVLSRLPKDFLNSEQLNYLSQFYADRIKDHHNVMPAVIDGIAALIHKTHFPPECVEILLRNFFQHTTCQSQARTDRGKLYRIFKYLTDNYLDVLISMSGNFVYGLINSIDGERDPRNLDYIFTFMPSVISKLPLLHLSEEMFEIFACYFPIDFTPQKSDPDTVTREDLAEKLINCLVASPDFIEWTIPLALEKLESDLTVAKIDSLALLRQAAIRFNIKSLEVHFEQIWQALRVELLPGSEKEEVIASSLQTLKIILEKAGKLPEVSHNFQTVILGNILPHLNDVNQRLFNPAIAVALVCISGDPAFVTDKILNTFYLKLRAQDESVMSTDDEMRDSDKTKLKPLNNEEHLKIYNLIEQIYKIASITDDTLQHVNSSVSQALQSEVVATLNLGLQETAADLELKIVALRILTECTPIINEKNRVLLYKILVHIITNEIIDLDCTHLLERLGALYPIELQSNCIDSFERNFIILPNFVKTKIFRNLLPLVKQISFTERILNLIFVNIFDNGNARDARNHDEVRAIALHALNKLLLSEDDKFIESLQHNYNLIDRLIELTKNLEWLDADASLPQLCVCQLICEILCIIVRNLSVAEQYAISTTYLPNLNLQLARDLYIANGLLGYLHKDISLDNHFDSLLNDLIKLSLTSEKDELREVAHHLVCSMVNKADHNNEMTKSTITNVLKMLKEYIQQNNEKAVEILSWICKGLAVRGCDEVPDIIETFLELLDHPSLQKAAILAFKIISVEFPQLHLPIVKFLFKQKFFHIILEKLKTKLANFSEQHVNAFIYVLSATPHAVLKMNIEKIGPIVFKSLDATDSVTLLIALSVCENFIKQQDDYFRSHLNHIIPSFLQLAKFKQSMNVRIQSLNLLRDITRYPTYVLLPFRMDVILELALPLDDMKRLVRNAAVKARNAWFLVGAPSSSE